MDHQNHPMVVKFSPVPGFTLTTIAAVATKNSVIPAQLGIHSAFAEPLP